MDFPRQDQPVFVITKLLTNTLSVSIYFLSGRQKSVEYTSSVQLNQLQVSAEKRLSFLISMWRQEGKN